MKHICPLSDSKCAHVNCMWWDEEIMECAVIGMVRELRCFNEQVDNIRDYGLTTKEV